MEVFVSNVKISCKICTLNASQLSFNTDNTIKEYNNFIVVKNKFAYIIFTKSTTFRNYHVNITKIPSLDQIPNALKELNNIINETFSIKNIKIENLTCLHHLNLNINLLETFKKFQSHLFPEVIYVRYNAEKFPGIFVKLNKCSILIFSSGKLVVIGASSEEKAKEGISTIINAIKNCNKI